MKKNTFLIPVVLFFIACGTNNLAPTEQQIHAIEYALLEDIFETKGKALTAKEGGSVNKADVKECINAYDSVMKLRNFTPNNSPQTPVQVPSMQITNSVNFHGKGLADWIMDVRKKAGGSLDTINLRIRFGIYTKNYVNTHAQIPSKHAGRISVFIIPYSINYVKKLSDSTEIDDAFGDKVYNLGGLQP